MLGSQKGRELSVLIRSKSPAKMNTNSLNNAYYYISSLTVILMSLDAALTSPKTTRLQTPS